jgi:hypothetical protein
VEQADGEVERAEQGRHQDVGAKGPGFEGAVPVHLEADAGVDSVEERAQEEPCTEQRRRDGRPGAPPRSWDHDRGRRLSAAAVVQRVGRLERPTARDLAMVPRGVRRPRWRRGAGGEEHDHLGVHCMPLIRLLSCGLGGPHGVAQ